MTRKMHILAVPVLAAAMLIGCSDKKTCTTAPKKGGDTPKEALLNIVKAAEAEDPDAFMASVYVPEEGREYVRQITAGMKTMLALNKASLEAYGKEAMITMSLKDRNLPAAEDIENMEFTIKDDKATAQGKYKVLEMILIDGKWYYDFSKGLPSESERKKTAEMMKTVAKAEKEILPKIGTSGYTFEDLQKDLKVLDKEGVVYED